MKTKLIKLLIPLIFLLMPFTAKANLTACGAILCLAGGAGFPACNPYLGAYYGIVHKYLKDTLKARFNWLMTCPKQNSGWLKDIVYSGGAACTPDKLNAARKQCREDEYQDSSFTPSLKYLIKVDNNDDDNSNQHITEFNAYTGAGCGVVTMPDLCVRYFKKYPDYDYIKMVEDKENCYKVRYSSAKKSDNSFLLKVDSDYEEEQYRLVCPKKFVNKYKK